MTTTTTTTTATLLPALLTEQINHMIDQLVELQLAFQEGEVTVYHYDIQCSKLYEQLTLLRQQQAEW